MFGAQGGFPPPQQGMFNPGAPRNGPPPTKKAKGNPIITRYPPPPGYQPPVLQQPPQYQQSGWPPQHHPQPFSQQPPHAGYNAAAHGQPQAYPHSQWQGSGQQHQYPTPDQPFHSQRQAAQSWGAPPQANAHVAPAANPAKWQIPPNGDPYSAPTQSSYPPSDFFSSHKRRHQSEPFARMNAGQNGVLDGNGEPLQPPSPRDDQGLENDFDGECYFLRHPTDIDPNLSLGELVWHPAQRTVLALPSTYKESQLEIIAPRKEPARSETSVSEYFFQDKRDQALLSIRQMDEWWKVKGDLIFKEFAPQPKELISKSDLLEKYRDRPDPGWLQPSGTATPEPGDYAADAVGGAQESAIVDDDSSKSHDKQQAIDEDGDILGSLEQALQRNTSRAGRHSRANSTTSIASNHSSKLRPLMPVRDRAQDDVLAALGVTGSPKMVYETPGPAFGPPPSQTREGSVSRDHSRRSSVASNSGAHATPQNPPPPPPGQPHYYARRPSHHDNRRSYGQGYYSNGYDNGRRGSNASHHSSRPGSSGSARPGSSCSRYAANGSEFAPVDEDRTPRAKYDRTDSRKRGYEDYDYGNRERDDDATPRQQRFKQPRYDGPYGRRW